MALNFIETRGNEKGRKSKVSFSEAVLNPSASFGGLYVPEKLPQLQFEELTDLNYFDLAFTVLKSFEIDVSDEVLKEAINLYKKFDNPSEPVPVVDVGDNLYIAELYHGATRAFKDMALQPFGYLLSSLAQSRNEKYLILAATSGDTGPATLETFKNRENISVICLYPEGGTSDVQKLQMVTEDGKNLEVIGINGSFDDAQTSLKNLLKSEKFKNQLAKNGVKLSAANSVNFGRIIFQTIYHIYSYLELLRRNQIKLGDQINIIVPSGNFGNALGGFYAKMMGVPINKIIIASNENNVLTEFIETGKYDIHNRKVINTLSPAMDILKSSNVERVLFTLFGAERTKDLMLQLEKNGKYQLSNDEVSKVQEIFRATFSTDDEVLEVINNYFYEKNYLLDPHTATVVKAHKKYSKDGIKNVAYSTAEWTKFSPAIIKALKIGDNSLRDKEALEKVAEKTGAKIPSQIAELFEKEIKHKKVVDVEKLEEEILNCQHLFS